jgi:hypothetical protein
MAQVSPAPIARAIAGGLLAALLVASCASTTSPSPAAVAPSMPTPMLVTAAPTTTFAPDPLATSAPSGGPAASTAASPGASPAGTTAPTPIPTPARDLALEATLPSEFEGMLIDRTSATLTDNAVASRGVSLKPVTDFLAKLGLKPSAFSQAAGHPADRSKPYQFIAYRFRGATEPDMLPAFLATLTEAGIAADIGSADVGGRHVGTFTSTAFTGSLAGATQYVYQKGDTIYGIITADKDLAAMALAVLP